MKVKPWGRERESEKPILEEHKYLVMIRYNVGLLCSRIVSNYGFFDDRFILNLRPNNDFLFGSREKQIKPTQNWFLLGSVKAH